ncbi:MAG: class II fumarate hydratase [Planctomycetaceae bacterium]|jgi:fumarate hydratase class II|nr:class II fumarate hydratase [Planctomycetaceae bacterium]
MLQTRIEHDSMGDVLLPHDVYYGAQTQRAVENFPISGKQVPAALIHALGLVKWAAATANAKLGLLSSGRSPLNEQEITALQTACLEVADGNFDDQFPVDVYQTGSGTSTNMNVNEVIANRAIELCGGDRFSQEKRIHPNDHVNMGQSTNDIFPTAIHVAVRELIDKKLLPALVKMGQAIDEKAAAWENILKIGRTHLADATPLTLGQEFSGFAGQIGGLFGNVQFARNLLEDLPVGGTAVGTGINTHPQFGTMVAKYLTRHFEPAWEESDDEFSDMLPGHYRRAGNPFAANAQRDQLVQTHGIIKSVAVTLMNIANNIRWLGSGPRCGFYEVKIPDLQPGSSIMPGKVNPVLCEALMQTCAKVIGNDQTITTCGTIGGQFQLNVMMPVMADVAIESVEILSGALNVFTEKCLKGLEANEEKCREGVEKSISMATALNPYIGYEQAAAIAKEAFQTGKTIREICLQKKILPPEKLAEILDPIRMAQARNDKVKNL